LFSSATWLQTEEGVSEDSDPDTIIATGCYKPLRMQPQSDVAKLRPV